MEVAAAAAAPRRVEDEEEEMEIKVLLAVLETTIKAMKVMVITME